MWADRWHREEAEQPALRQEDAERYSRRRNLRLLNVPEHSSQDVRTEVMDIAAQIIPEEKSSLGFMIDHVLDEGEVTTARVLSSCTSPRAPFNTKYDSFPQLWCDEEEQSAGVWRSHLHGETKAGSSSGPWSNKPETRGERLSGSV